MHLMPLIPFQERTVLLTHGDYLLELTELSFEACQQVLVCTSSLQYRNILLDRWQVELFVQAAESCIADSPELNLCRPCKAVSAVNR